MCFSLKDGDSSNFDAVILTQPTPQILDVVGAAGVPSDVIAELGNVEYSSRFALAVYYDGDNIGYDSMLEGVNAKYISGEPIVRFVALGNLKTDGKSSPGSKLSVVVHTSGPFGTDNLEASKEEMGPVMEVRKWMIRVDRQQCLSDFSLSPFSRKSCENYSRLGLRASTRSHTNGDIRKSRDLTRNRPVAFLSVTIPRRSSLPVTLSRIQTSTAVSHPRRP